MLNNEAGEKKMVRTQKPKMRVHNYESHLSDFDDYVAREKFRDSKSYRFEMGDIVWGKVKSHPWWPGYVLNEAFVSLSVRRMKKLGHVLVAFFGDSTYGWFHPSEIIPFEVDFEEKSKQTVSSSFVKAVEEAVDEIGKRSGLGLTCKCRNPLNFRSSNVDGYSVVDVIGYEQQQGVYSCKQIKKARDEFSCGETLEFVKWCALAPGVCGGTERLKFYQRKAAVFAFRRAVFEEFDETYKQAFGVSSGYSSVKTEEVIDRDHPRALLGGSLVITEAPGYAKRPIMKVKDSIKAEKYLPRRRQEAGGMTVQFGQVQASSQLQGTNGTSAGDHLLQRQTPYLQTPLKDEQTGLVSMDFTFSSGQSYVSKLSPDDDKGLAQEFKVGIRGKAALISDNEKFEAMSSLKQEDSGSQSRSNKGSVQLFIEKKGSAGVGIKKVNVLKRSSEEMDFENAPPDPKKKNRKKEPRSERNSDSSDKRNALSQSGSAERQSDMLNSRNSKFDVLQLLRNLQALSLDPFYGSFDTSSMRAVRQFLLRFRSLVYHKSLDSSPPPTTKLSNSAKSLSSTIEPSKAGRKRLSPDPQQEIPSTKKLKKTSQVRPIASYKQTNQESKKISNLAPLKPVRDQGGSAPINAKAQPGKKTAPSAKVIEPTMLVMKFPSGSSLPSVALLKARYSRFGMLDQSATRVFWKSSTCRVVFLYKLDAQTALRYVSGNNSLFGGVNVEYSLVDVNAAIASRDREQKKAKTDEPIIERPSQRRKQTPLQQQLKSCLKKPGDNSTGNRRTTRVKFMMDGKETERAYPASSLKQGNYASPSSSVAMDFVSKNNQNIVPSTLPLVLPLTSQYSTPEPVNNSVDHVESTQCTVDISQQMMKLLLRCNDVVANVKSSLGYIPYHSL